MKIAIDGLGKMGMQIAERLVLDKHEVIAHNRTPDKIDQIKKSFGATAAYSKEEVVSNFNGSQVILWIMIPASAVDHELDEWLKLLKPGDIIIDGGNSNFQDTQKHSQKTKAHKIELVDIGTSGGILGLLHGFSMMIGGDEQAFKTIEPALKSLTAPEGAYQYFGPSGSGHFVKMVHNAIEYGVMESLAEGYRLLKEGPFKNIDLAAAGEVWQHSSIIASDLNDLTAEVLIENPDLKGIDGFVAESGEARWSLEIARQHHIGMPSIQSAFDVRIASQKGEVNFATKLLAAMRNKFGGHDLNKK